MVTVLLIQSYNLGQIYPSQTTNFALNIEDTIFYSVKALIFQVTKGSANRWIWNNLENPKIFLKDSWLDALRSTVSSAQCWSFYSSCWTLRNSMITWLEICYIECGIYYNWFSSILCMCVGSRRKCVQNETKWTRWFGVLSNQYFGCEHSDFSILYMVGHLL